MSDQLHSQDEVKRLKIVDTPHRIHPDHHTDKYFAIATANGEDNLERKAREGFMEVEYLPDYIYIPEKNKLRVGDVTVHYALVCGVYSR